MARHKIDRKQFLLYFLLLLTYLLAMGLQITAIIPLIGYIILAFKFVENTLKPVVIFKSISVILVLASSFYYPLSGYVYLIIFSIVEILSTLLNLIITKRSFYDMWPPPKKRTDIIVIKFLYPLLLGVWIFAMIMLDPSYRYFFTLVFLFVSTVGLMNMILNNNISGNTDYNYFKTQEN